MFPTSEPSTDSNSAPPPLNDHPIGHNSIAGQLSTSPIYCQTSSIVSLITLNHIVHRKLSLLSKNIPPPSSALVLEKIVLPSRIKRLFSESMHPNLSAVLAPHCIAECDSSRDDIQSTSSGIILEAWTTS